MTSSNRRKFLKHSAILGMGMLGRPVYAYSHAPKGKTKDLPLHHETDICVLGGSCTGVFAAVRAARLGARVTIIEQQNAFGGVATNALVFVWHSLKNTTFDKDIIAGCTRETMDRLQKRSAVIEKDGNPSGAFRFNSQELKIELDEMVLEEGIKPMLHTWYSEPVTDSNGHLTGIVVQNKDGRSVIKAHQFIDATGDGDLAMSLGIASYTAEQLLPPTTCAHIDGYNKVRWEVNDLLKKHHEEFNIPLGFVWGNNIPDSSSFMLAGTRVYGADCSKAEDLTKAEMEGRRQVRAIMDMIRKYHPEHDLSLTALPSLIGIRQTRQFRCMHQLTGEEVLNGTSFEDAIAYGSYRVDIHHQDKPGITFKYLDGTQEYVVSGKDRLKSRWREKTETNPTYYQIPLRSIIPGKYNNLILAGRMLDADLVAFSGVRVMVNMNQLGEAAGVAAYLAAQQNKPIAEVNADQVRKTLNKGGSVL